MTQHLLSTAKPNPNPNYNPIANLNTNPIHKPSLTLVLAGQLILGLSNRRTIEQPPIHKCHTISQMTGKTASSSNTRTSATATKHATSRNSEQIGAQPIQ